MNSYASFFPSWYPKWYRIGFVLLIVGALLFIYVIRHQPQSDAIIILGKSAVTVITVAWLLMCLTHFIAHFVALRRVQARFPATGHQVARAFVIYWVRVVMNIAFIAGILVLVIYRIDVDKLPVPPALLLLISVSRLSWSSALGTLQVLMNKPAAGPHQQER